MNTYIGIDLGTTNSAICSYDGNELRIWKSHEQTDVTPSAIYIDKKGRKRYGIRAYQQLASDPDRVAALFKRFMGSNTKIVISGSQNDGSPEAWSAELLRELYGYLPEGIRDDENTGIVITVPAAFDEMQKDATMHAANMAALGKVALMQEPVAAIMAVMRKRQKDGTFLIYDLGGGTLDIAVAQSIAGKVSLIAHGGIGLCGGRDIDRLIVENVIIPYIEENYAVPEDYESDPSYKTLLRIAPYLAESAKIELSSRESAVILSPDSLDLEDENGDEISFEIPINRQLVDELISDLVEETITASREAIAKAGLEPDQIDQIVFVGGPTNYKPLRDRVATELGIEANIEINPMTAVAEGAAIFAESIDWSTRSRLRKSSRGQLDGNGISFRYNARTPGKKAKIVAQLLDKGINGAEFEVTSLDTGWNSGRLPLKHGAAVEVDLYKKGDNKFRVTVFDSSGSPHQRENWEIIITQAAATIDAIPASHSIGIEVEDQRKNRKLDYIVRSGDPLPHKGKVTYKANAEIRAGQAASLKIRMWEGEIEHPVEDNRHIGCLEITGSDFEGGVIREGDEIICDYEVLDSGQIRLHASIPSVGAVLDGSKNFYSRQDAQIDFATAAARIQQEGERVQERVDDLSLVIDDPKLEQARNKLMLAESLRSGDPEIERNKEAEENIQQAKKLLYQARLAHLAEIRASELESYLEHYNGQIRQYARPQEATQFDRLVTTARRSLEQNDNNFDYYMSEMRGQGFAVLWRQDWFAEQIFRSFEGRGFYFDDEDQYENLMRLGREAIEKENWQLLRTIIGQLYEAQSGFASMEEDFGAVNISK